MFSYENCLVAMMEGTQRKRGKRCVKPFMFTDEEVKEMPSRFRQIDPQKVRPYAEQLNEKLRAGRWKVHKPFHKHVYLKSKSKKNGKWRDLFIPDLETHIVNHMLLQSCMPAFTRGMHPYSCGSVPGRGIRYVVNTVSRWMLNDKECRYFVIVDIRQFFQTIDADILMEKLKKKIKDKYALDLFDQFIHCCPIPCPMGLYSSPWLANLYLQDLDWFIEQELYKERRGKRIKFVRHYIRYMDDMLLIGTSKADLYKAVKAIEKFLLEKLQLRIKPTWEIKRIGKHEGLWKLKPGTYWCDYVGYKFSKDATVLRSGIFLATSRLARKMYKAEYHNPQQCAALISRLGWAKHCDSNRFLERYIKPFVNIKEIRRILSYVDKNSKRGKCKATCSFC